MFGLGIQELLLILIIFGPFIVILIFLKKSRRNRNNPSTPFASGHSRAQWVTWLLVVAIVLNLIAIVSVSYQIDLLSKAMSGQTITAAAEAAANDSRQQLIGVLQVLVLLVTAMLFLIWLHRAYRNLPALGARNLAYSPQWVVGGFFVPFLNLVRPFQVVREIWNTSDPDVTNDSSPQSTRTPPLVGWWWTLFLISSFMSRMTLHGGTTVSSMLDMSWIMLVANILDIPSAILALLVVRAINTRQEEKSKRLMRPGDRDPV